MTYVIFLCCYSQYLALLVDHVTHVIFLSSYSQYLALFIDHVTRGISMLLFTVFNTAY